MIWPLGSVYRHLSAGVGTKGKRLHDWAYLELAFFSTWCPGGTPIATLVRVEGH